MTRFLPGSLALVRGSFEEVEVIASSEDNVLVKRAGGQTAYPADQLVPHEPEVCPID